MSYQIKLKKDVKKFLAKHELIAKLFYQKLVIIANSDKNSFEGVDVKPLKWKKGHFRLRIGKYRFLYQIIENKLLIYFYEVDSRGDVY